MYKIMCVFTYIYIHSQNITICQRVLICNKQHYVIYNNYMFRPCKRAITRLLTEPSSILHNRSLGGTGDEGDEISSYINLSMYVTCYNTE